MKNFNIYLRKSSLNKTVQPIYARVTSFTRASSYRWQKGFIPSIISNHLISYATPANLSYSWSFGSLAGLCLLTQILTGVFLAMFYVPNVNLAVASLNFIMHDVPYGWFVRYTHSNGASMFLFVVYCHVFKGLYYNSYIKPRGLLWVSGVVILFLTMGTAFLGYVLPWGQMSFWGATVITNMVTIVPYFGDALLEWLWGGYTINNPTLHRFFVIHFVLPFVISGLVFIHLALLHQEGSSAPISDSTGVDPVRFYPYFFVKDVFAFLCVLLVFSFLVFYYPNLLGDPLNFVKIDRIKTPVHIVPEWYFLPFYGVLKSVPHKVGGVLLMFFSIFVLFLLPILNTSTVKDSTYRLFFKLFFSLVIISIVGLYYVGKKPIFLKPKLQFINEAVSLYGRYLIAVYFSFFLLFLPTVNFLETLWVFHRFSTSFKFDDCFYSFFTKNKTLITSVLFLLCFLFVLDFSCLLLEFVETATVFIVWSRLNHRLQVL